MTDDELIDAVTASLPGTWTTDVYRRNGMRLLRSTRDVAGETACVITAISGDLEPHQLEDAIHGHVHRGIDDVAALIVVTAARDGILPS